MSKHTPGPWVIRDKEPVVVHLGPGSRMHVIETCGDETFHIGFASSWVNNPEDAKEAIANANLIAAAPDLLADLELAAETLRRYEALHRAKGTQESLDKADANQALAIRFEATIARAKGETQ